MSKVIALATVLVLAVSHLSSYEVDSFSFAPTGYCYMESDCSDVRWLGFVGMPQPKHNHIDKPVRLVESRATRFNRKLTWLRLADCESGDWVDRGASFVHGSARWSLAPGQLHSSIFEGGLQFHPRTWDWLRPSDYPSSAHLATRAQQINVAEKVLELQGWKAWPVCAKKLGLY